MNELALKENLEKDTKIETCPVRNVLARFSGKWSILILCVISENERTRFNEISKGIPDISSKVLTDTLKNLEANNLIIRHYYGGIPPRVEYSLSALGKSLIPKLGELINWAVENFDKFKN